MNEYHIGEHSQDNTDGHIFKIRGRGTAAGKAVNPAMVTAAYSGTARRTEPVLFREIFYSQPVILVDGITRTGKSMLGPLLASFEGVEMERMEMILERIPQLYVMGKLKKDAAIALLRLEIQMKLYESMIARNANFRWGDHSGVFSQVRWWRYLRRLFQPEGNVVVEKIRQEQPIFQVQQHDVLGMSQIYFEAFGNSLRILEMIRHPVDVVHSQWKRGYGSREEKDPRIFSLTMQYQGKQLPRHAWGIEEEYLAASQMDRVIRMYANRLRWMQEGYKALSPGQKQQVLFIPFERFVEEPEPYLLKIEELIGRRRTRHAPKALKQQRCPRKLDVEERGRKEQEIRAQASEECFRLLENLSRKYEKFVAGLEFSNNRKVNYSGNVRAGDAGDTGVAANGL